MKAIFRGRLQSDPVWKNGYFVLSLACSHDDGEKIQHIVKVFSKCEIAYINKIPFEVGTEIVGRGMVKPETAQDAEGKSYIKVCSKYNKAQFIRRLEDVPQCPKDDKDCVLSKRYGCPQEFSEELSEEDS